MPPSPPLLKYLMPRCRTAAYIMGVITTARYYLILLSSSEAGVSCKVAVGTGAWVIAAVIPKY